MKIKTDFVTNSSSTCYVMSAIVSGSFPQLSKPFEGLAKYYPNQDFVYKDYVHIKTEGSVENAYHDSEPEYGIDLVLDNIVIYDDDDNEKYVTLFKLFINLLNPYHYEMEDRVKDFLETLLFKQLNEKIIPSQLTYFAWPSDVYGDGWDGGDPQGPENNLTYKHELYRAKTKMGIITAMDKSIISEIRSIEQPFNVNEILLENINQQGLSLEGTK